MRVEGSLKQRALERQPIEYTLQSILIRQHFSKATSADTHTHTWVTLTHTQACLREAPHVKPNEYAHEHSCVCVCVCLHCVSMTRVNKCSHAFQRSVSSYQDDLDTHTHTHCLTHTHNALTHSLPPLSAPPPVRQNPPIPVTCRGGLYCVWPALNLF